MGGVYFRMEAYHRLPGREDMTPDQRLDALAEALAAGILHLGETGQLTTWLQDSSQESTPPLDAPASQKALKAAAERR